MPKKQFLQHLHETIKQLAPIDGCSASANTPKEEWVVWFKPEANTEQQVAVQTFIDSVDPLAWETQQEDDEAAEDVRIESIVNEPNYQDLLDKLRTMTPAQWQAYLEANLTTVAGARTVIYRMGLALMLLARKL